MMALSVFPAGHAVYYDRSVDPKSLEHLHSVLADLGLFERVSAVRYSRRGEGHALTIFCDENWRSELYRMKREHGPGLTERLGKPLHLAAADRAWHVRIRTVIK